MNERMNGCKELTPVDIPTGILLSYSETKSCEDCLAIVVELRYQCGSGASPPQILSAVHKAATPAGTSNISKFGFSVL